VAGSCWPPEEKLLMEFFSTNGMPVNRKFVLVPHDIGKNIYRRFKNVFQNIPVLPTAIGKTAPIYPKPKF
jgi:hypothetical protein